MKLSSYTSNKIKIISFICIVLVLYIHASFNEASKFTLNHLTQEVISVRVGMLAVPVFYLISGYLFALGLDLQGFSAIGQKIIKRFKTLVIPYIIGCLFFFSFIYFINLVPILRVNVNSTLDFAHLTILEKLRNIFIIAPPNNGPLAFHLWFLRNLIILVFLSPILFYLIKFLKWTLLLAFLFLLGYPNLDFLRLFYSLFWFCTGWMLCVQKVNVEYKQNKVLVSASAIFFLVASLACIYFKYNSLYLNTIIQLSGIYTFWFMSDDIYHSFINKGKGKQFVYSISDYFSKFTLFVYLFHEPTINVIRKIIVIILGKSSVGYLISYLVSPILFVFIACWLADFLSKNLPKFYNVLVGGRNF